MIEMKDLFNKALLGGILGGLFVVIIFMAVILSTKKLSQRWGYN